VESSSRNELTETYDAKQNLAQDGPPRLATSPTITIDLYSSSKFNQGSGGQLQIITKAATYNYLL
jgi:hypothetical protein